MMEFLTQVLQSYTINFVVYKTSLFFNWIGPSNFFYPDIEHTFINVISNRIVSIFNDYFFASYINYINILMFERADFFSYLEHSLNLNADSGSSTSSTTSSTISIVQNYENLIEFLYDGTHGTLIQIGKIALVVLIINLDNLVLAYGLNKLYFNYLVNYLFNSSTNLYDLTYYKNKLIGFKHNLDLDQGSDFTKNALFDHLNTESSKIYYHEDLLKFSEKISSIINFNITNLKSQTSNLISLHENSFIENLDISISNSLFFENLLLNSQNLATSVINTLNVLLHLPIYNDIGEKDSITLLKKDLNLIFVDLDSYIYLIMQTKELSLLLKHTFILYNSFDLFNT